MRPSGSTKDRQPISNPEFKRLIEVTQRDKALQRNTRLKMIRAFTLLRLSACRVSEIIEFSVADIDRITRTGSISLNNQNKTKKPRLLRFNQNGITMLRSLDISDTNGALFYKNASSSNMSVAVFTRELNKQIKKVLGDLYTSHSFRAGLITDILQATGNIKIAQAVAGHSSYKTTLEYIKASNEQIYEAIGKVI
jgi:integrase/recombinase XerD